METHGEALALRKQHTPAVGLIRPLVACVAKPLKGFVPYKPPTPLAPVRHPLGCRLIACNIATSNFFRALRPNVFGGVRYPAKNNVHTIYYIFKS